MFESTIQVGSSFEPAAAALLVQTASKFRSHISLALDEKTANAKSIMGIISLNMHAGQTIKIVAEGEDAKDALLEMEGFFTQ